MSILLRKATYKDVSELHRLKIESFLPLLKIYKDFDTSPATEHLDKIIRQVNSSKNDYYLINYNNINVGGVRVVKAKEASYRISPIFILPKYHNLGIAQIVFKLLEENYADAKSWQLDTILEEKGLCYLYEKIGYVKTGKTKEVKDKFTIVFYEKQIS